MNENRNAFIKQLLKDSGIVKNMRILDVGCGSGEVSILLSELMEDTGEIIGVDIDESAVESARISVKNKGIKNISFIAGEIETLDDDLKYFDAIVGRRVLMYLPNPYNTIKILKSYLKPDGLMIFQESDSGGSNLTAKNLKKHAQVQKWVWDTIKREGGNINIGSEMYGLFIKAGLNVKDVKAEAVLQTAGNDLAWLIKVMMPRIIKTGVATKEEIDIENLEKVLLEEMAASKSIFIRDINFGICAANIL